MIDSLNLSFDCFIGAILKAIEIETNTQHFDNCFLQNCKKSKYHFLTFLPVTWVKIVIQKRAVYQMNGWNLYFLAYFMCNIQKINLRRPRTSNITVKFIEWPFIWGKIWGATIQCTLTQYSFFVFQYQIGIVCLQYYCM